MSPGFSLVVILSVAVSGESSAADPQQHFQVEAAAGQEEVQPVGLRDQLSGIEKPLHASAQLLLPHLPHVTCHLQLNLISLESFA